MDKVKLGIIGAGNIARVHLESISYAKNCEVVAIYDRQPEVAKEAAEKFGVKAEESLEALLAREDIEGVILAVPNYQHNPCCLAAIAAGKHVLTEKPMALTVAQAEEMVEAAKKANVKLAVGLCSRFMAEPQIVRERVEKGEMGHIYAANCSVLRRRGAPIGWFTDKSRSGGGPLIDIGVHAIDVAWYMMGKPKPVLAKALNYAEIEHKHLKGMENYVAFEKGDVYDVEDISFGMITFENGECMRYEAGNTNNGREKDFEIELMGSKGGVQVTPLVFYGESCDGYFAEEKPQYVTTFEFTKQAENFAAAIRGEEELRTPGEDGLVVQKMLNALYRSAESGREVEV